MRRIFQMILGIGFLLAATAPSSFAESPWAVYPDPNTIMDIAPEGEHIWFATRGGILCFNRNDCSYRVFTTRDGLPGNHIVAVAIGNDARPWCIIGDTVVSFDGTTWKNHTAAGGLPRTAWQSLAIDGTGAVWLGSPAGLVRYDGAACKTYTIADGLPDNNIICIHAAPDHTVWAGTRKGLSHFDGKAWNTVTIAGRPFSNRINDIGVDDAGAVWAATSVGVLRFDGTGWKTYTALDGIAGNAVLSLAVGRNGEVWAGSGEGLSKFDGVSWTPVSSLQTGRSGETVRVIAADGDHGIWVDDDFQGFCRFDGTEWKRYTIPGLLHCWGEYVNCGAVDSARAVWFGNDHSLACFDGKTWQNFRTGEWQTSGGVTSIAVDRNNDKWIGTGSGVFKFDGTAWLKYSSDTGLAGNVVRAIAIAANGTKWIGTDTGLSSFDGVQWKKFGIQEGLLDERVSRLAIDRQDNLWAVTEKGVSRFDGTAWENFPNEAYFGSEPVSSVAVDKSGVLWFGMPGRIVSFENSTWKTYTEQDTGFPLGLTIKAIAAAPDNTKWFGTGGAGVVRFDGKRWDRFIRSDLADPGDEHTHGVDIPNNYVTVAVADRSGTVWFGGYDSGIFRFSGGDPGIPTAISDHQISLPSELAIRGIYPNPFNPSTAIEFLLPSKAPVSLEIYAITGQKVYSLWSDRMQPGLNTFFWNGRDADGKPVSSGVYIVRLEAGKAARSMKMLLMR